jgi:hypothetical protein
MPLLTIFTSPKPFNFSEHVSLIQRNAIQSWKRLGNDVEVFLMGDEIGMADISREFSIRHFPEVKYSDESTPYISSMLELARDASSAPYLTITNADVIFLPDFLESLVKVAAQTKNFLIISRRWDLDLSESVDFSPGWDERLKSEVKIRGVLHGPVGSDHFTFPRHLLKNMPEFTIGRSGWDNWTIYHARKSGWDVVDVSRTATIIHQNHDYSHLPNGEPPYDLPETKRNVMMAGGMKTMYTILEANKVLSDGRLTRNPVTVPRLLHRLELSITDDDPQGIRSAIIRWLRRSRRKYERQL